MAMHLARFPAPEGVRFFGKAREDPRLPDGEADQRWPLASATPDRPWHRHGQPLLLLRRGPGLRPLPGQDKVLFGLPLNGQALPQQARAGEAATRPADPAAGD